MLDFGQDVMEERMSCVWSSLFHDYSYWRLSCGGGGMSHYTPKTQK